MDSLSRLDRCTVVELRHLATACDLRGRSRMVKAALVAALAVAYTTAEALAPELEVLQLKAQRRPVAARPAQRAPRVAVRNSKLEEYKAAIARGQREQAAYFPSGSNRPAEILGLVGAAATLSPTP